jgi:hypothetical protein
LVRCAISLANARRSSRVMRAQIGHADFRVESSCPQMVTDSPASIVGLGGAGEDPPVRSGSGGLMPNTSVMTAAITNGVLGAIFLATLF